MGERWRWAASLRSSPTAGKLSHPLLRAGSSKSWDIRSGAVFSKCPPLATLSVERNRNWEIVNRMANPYSSFHSRNAPKRSTFDKLSDKLKP